MNGARLLLLDTGPIVSTEEGFQGEMTTYGVCLIVLHGSGDMMPSANTSSCLECNDVVAV